MMVDNKGNIVPIIWICHNKSCCYPHYANRPTCVNCRAKRVKDQEPSTFIRSRIRVIGAKPFQGSNQGQPGSAEPKPQPTPPVHITTEHTLQQQADSEQPAADNADSGQAADAAEGQPTSEQPEATSPAYVPKCLSAGTVKFLIGNGVDAATAYKGHFDIKIQGLSELQVQLDVASRRLAILETADPVLFASDLVTAKEVVRNVEVAIAAIVGEDGAALDPAPGAENGLVGKLASLLSRHQKNMAKEEADYASTTAELEARSQRSEPNKLLRPNYTRPS